MLIPFKIPNELEPLFSSWHEILCETESRPLFNRRKLLESYTGLPRFLLTSLPWETGWEVLQSCLRWGQEANLGWITSCTPTSPHLPVTGRLRPWAQSSVWYAVNLKMQPLFCLHPGFTPLTFPKDLWPVLGTYRRSGSFIRWWFYWGGKGAATVSSLQMTSLLMWCRSCCILAFWLLTKLFFLIKALKSVQSRFSSVFPGSQL